jgi:hypothetical protein
MCAASAAKPLLYFYHSETLKRSRLSDVLSVRAISSKSKSPPSLQRQARNHSSYFLPVILLFLNLLPATAYDRKSTLFPLKFHFPPCHLDSELWHGIMILLKGSGKRDSFDALIW